MLISEEVIATMSASEQLELARRFVGSEAAERVQLGRCLLTMHTSHNYQRCGFRSVLHTDLDVDPETIRQCLRITFLLRRLPLVCKAVESGELSWGALLSLLRQAQPETEHFWLERARQVADNELEKLVRRELKKGRMITQIEWSRLEAELPLTQFEDSLQRAVCENFHPPMSDEDCLLLFGVLHNCCIDYDSISWAPQTQRGAASLLADIWKGTDTARSNYTYWYWGWLHKPEPFSLLTGDALVRLEEIRAQLESHPAIGSVVPEADEGDWPDSWPFGENASNA